jgi:hypothetical protein
MFALRRVSGDQVKRPRRSAIAELYLPHCSGFSSSGLLKTLGGLDLARLDLSGMEVVNADHVAAIGEMPSLELLVLAGCTSLESYELLPLRGMTTLRNLVLPIELEQSRLWIFETLELTNCTISFSN